MTIRGLFCVAMAIGVSILISCGHSDTAAPPPTTGSATPLTVGLLVSGSTSDGGWNQLAKDSLDKLAATEGVKTVVMQSVTKDVAADRMRQLAEKGCGLVIGHGYEFLKPAEAVAASGFKARLAVSGGDEPDPNVACLFYDLSGASYELGVLAAKVSKTGKLGFIAGAPFPTVTAMLRGFEAGAKSVNPQATVSASYPGWDDPSKSKQQAEAYIAQGIDVIMQNVDAASRGVFEAVHEANAKRQGDASYTAPIVYTFGANSDQNANPVCADYTLASAVIRMDDAFARLAKAAQDGTFKGGVINVDLASGISVAVINPKLKGTVITPEMEAAMEAARKKLVSGEITVPPAPK